MDRGTSRAEERAKLDARDRRERARFRAEESARVADHDATRDAIYDDEHSQ